MSARGRATLTRGEQEGRPDAVVNGDGEFAGIGSRLFRISRSLSALRGIDAPRVAKSARGSRIRNSPALAGRW